VEVETLNYAILSNYDSKVYDRYVETKNTQVNNLLNVILDEYILHTKRKGRKKNK